MSLESRAPARGLEIPNYLSHGYYAKLNGADVLTVARAVEVGVIPGIRIRKGRYTTYAIPEGTPWPKGTRKRLAPAGFLTLSQYATARRKHGNTVRRHLERIPGVTTDARGRIIIPEDAPWPSPERGDA